MDSDQLKEHLKFAAELGVTGTSRDSAWRTRQTPTSRPAAPAGIHAGGADPDAASTPPAADPGTPVALLRSAAEVLESIRREIGPACTRCKLHTLGRKQVVFGVGNPEAQLMFVGEAPGADEDEQGIPFVGRAGQLLTDIIEKGLQIPRKDVYIANVIKCRPPQNRNPEPDEVETCEPYLFQQIDAIKPKVIVGLGKFGAQTLLRTQEPISRLRGRVFEFRGSQLIPTFHPAYLLRNPPAKRDVWEDMKLVKRLLSEGA